MGSKNFHLNNNWGAILVLIASSAVCFAQSGRPVPTPTPAPAPKVETANPETAKDYPPCQEGLEDVIYIPPKAINEFVDEINRLGNCGYRLEKAARLPFGYEPEADLLAFGVVKLDPGSRYEYLGFVANSAGRIVTLANQLAARGFYFRKQMMFIRYGGYSRSGDDPLKDLAGMMKDIAGSGSVFIFERKNGVIKKNEYRVIDGWVETNKKSFARNQENLNDYVARGFRPVGVYYLGMFSAFAVIMEKDPEIKPAGEYLLYNKAYFMSKNFTKLGQQGYQPHLIGFYFALLHRTSNQPLNVKYDSAGEHDELIKKLPKLMEKGAEYSLTAIANYSCYEYCDPYEGKPFFAMPIAGPARKSDLKVLEMTNVWERRKKKETNASFREAPTPEKSAAFHKLLNEGYLIRDVFFARELIVLFERPG
jgi:hypothetical protein